ncbi:MAG: hypothetical protein Q8N03_13460 [Ignavibacteria bacterium]|jgi:hypothetical protein|nr:hypothetical protein [Ignavibacteria bacterium]MDP3829837.1 hypothetical protein [Ignavibacteriaceae bacterium]
MEDLSCEKTRSKENVEGTRTIESFSQLIEFKMIDRQMTVIAKKEFVSENIKYFCFQIFRRGCLVKARITNETMVIKTN